VNYGKHKQYANTGEVKFMTTAANIQIALN